MTITPSLPLAVVEAASRVTEFARQYRLRNDADPSGVMYNVWMDPNTEPAELRLGDLEALAALVLGTVNAPAAAKSHTRVPGHELISEGSPHDERGRPAQYLGTGDRGCGKCSCGALSTELTSGARRKAWHRDHKRAVTA